MNIFDVALWSLTILGVLLLLCAVVLSLLFIVEVRDDRRAEKELSEKRDEKWTCEFCHRNFNDDRDWNNKKVHYNYHHRNKGSGEGSVEWL